jgi:hypothetical protein
MIRQVPYLLVRSLRRVVEVYDLSSSFWVIEDGSDEVGNMLRLERRDVDGSVQRLFGDGFETGDTTSETLRGYHCRLLGTS